MSGSSTGQDPRRHPLPSLIFREPAGYLATPTRAYLRVPRELLDPEHPLSPTRTGEPASKVHALIDLKSMAAYRDGPDRVRGEVLAGTRWLGERWRWPRTRVRRFLEDLQENGTISWMRGTTRREPSRIIIVGYDRLQDRPKAGPVPSPVPLPGSPALSPPNNGAGSGDPVALSARPVPSPGHETPTKAEEPQSYHGEAGRADARAHEGVAQPESLFPELDGQEKKKQRGRGSVRQHSSNSDHPRDEKSAPPAASVVDDGHYCGSCGSPIGPTVDQCARCAYALEAAP